MLLNLMTKRSKNHTPASCCADSNATNTNIALCEETVYGLEIPGFKEAVKNWLNQHQPKAYGTFTRKGSEWSDTFQNTHTILPTHQDLTRENQTKLLDAIQNTHDMHHRLDLAQKIIANNKNFDQDFIHQVLEHVNQWFRTNEELAQTQHKIWNFYVPKALMEGGYEPNLIRDVIHRFPVEQNLFFIKTSPKVTQYLLPVLKDNARNIKDPNALADELADNPAVQTQEFIDLLPSSVIEELFQYVTHPKTQPLIAQRMMKMAIKQIAKFAPKAQEGDDHALDAITDEWIGPILDKLDRKQVNGFMQQVRTAIGEKLFQRLYGHVYH
jgi:hypothetical protein